MMKHLFSSLWAKLFVTGGAAFALVACGGGDAENTAPEARIAALQPVKVGTTVVLDGTASSDAEGDAISYVWSLVASPAGSAATLANAATATPQFVADLPGSYLIRLVVGDGSLQSPTATLAIVAAHPGVASRIDALFPLEISVAQHIGVNEAITVKALDAFGSPVAQVPVTFTRSGDSATGTIAAVTAGDGKAWVPYAESNRWFNYFHDVGTYTVSVTAEGLQTITFNVKVTPSTHIYDGEYQCTGDMGTITITNSTFHPPIGGLVTGTFSPETGQLNVTRLRPSGPTIFQGEARINASGQAFIEGSSYTPNLPPPSSSSSWSCARV